ncbi:MAG: 2-oxoacid:ferredoxin oxidoreductase subunit beta, partial [Deltaproteobacteria bacterium]|nr:2-oxoacid:ferredoxin oxidoreductase subunit beta [Deltaproteobacteria bacterium]
ARRNLNITAIIINNQVYGMTGGQHSPTTPYGCYTTTSSYGNIEHAFSIAELSVTAGAPFVARGTVYHAQLLEGLIEKGIRKRGFSVVEVISTCPVHFGRQNEMGDPVEMMKWLKDHAVTTKKADKMTPDALEDKFTIGVLTDVKKPIYTKEYQQIRKRAKALLKESKE